MILRTHTSSSRLLRYFANFARNSFFLCFPTQENAYARGFKAQFSLGSARERKTVGAEALGVLPVCGLFLIKARYSANFGSGAAFKRSRILNWRAKVLKFHQTALFKGGASSLP